MTHSSIHRPSALVAAIALGAFGAAFAQVTPTAVPVLQEPIVVQAPPQQVPQPPGLSGPLSRDGVTAEFEAMRAANVLVPAGEVGDTERTAERRNQYHRAQTQVWEDYQVRFAAYQAAEAQRAYDAAVLAEQRAREAEAAAAAAAANPATPPVEPAK